MIGVLCSHDERAAAEEFFQLFKTPWEFLRAEGRYPVVLSTRGDRHWPDARLAVVFSPAEIPLDADLGVDMGREVGGPIGDHDQTEVPVYSRTVSIVGSGTPLLFDSEGQDVVAVEFRQPQRTTIRAGYNLFDEVDHLLSEGQPSSNAHFPALDTHIRLLRSWILRQGVPVVEVPPIPLGHEFIACLTHDVDFIAARHYLLDRTGLGFLYRALVGSVIERLRGRGGWSRVKKNWMAVLSYPLVHLGLKEDFWDCFSEYIDLERGARATYFLIPFKNTPGESVSAPNVERRATRYDVDDLAIQIEELLDEGHEIGLHGIDAWHSPSLATRERERISMATEQEMIGVRMHWLCFEPASFSVLDQAGFDYDSTVGYNDAVGYRAGTNQAYRPLEVDRLLEVPLHFQDTALFLTTRLALSEKEAWRKYEMVLEHATEFGGLVTLLWHLRSLGPERLWGEFYQRCLAELRTRQAWITCASDAASWFRRRRSIIFEEKQSADGAVEVRIRLDNEVDESLPGYILRVYRPVSEKSSFSRVREESIDMPCVEGVLTTVSYF